MPALGIDYGTKRIGLSISRDMRFSNRLQTINNDSSSFEKIKEILSYENIDTIVVGLPRSLDGNDTQQTALARKFSSELEDKFEANVVLQDEADTSNMARERLKSQGMNDRQIEAEVDAESAVIILEDYLSEKRA